MLTREEKLSLYELPKVKEELDKNIQFLKELSNMKETISEDRYKQLENKYSTGISELKAKKERITNQFEMKKDELKIQKVTLQNRRQEVMNTLQEITQLKGKNAISDEEYKLERKKQNTLLKEIDKEALLINMVFEEINLYLTAIGNVDGKSTKLKRMLFSGEKSGNNKFLPKLNWKSAVIFALIIIFAVVMIVNKSIGDKYSDEIERELNSKLQDLKEILEFGDAKVKFAYSDISVNPILSTITISDLELSLNNSGYRKKSRRIGENHSLKVYYEHIEELKCSSIKLKLSYKEAKKLMAGYPTITSTKISLSNLSFNNYTNDGFQEKIDIENFKLAFNGDLNNSLFSGNSNYFLSSKQKVKIDVKGIRYFNGGQNEDGFTNELLGLNLNEEQIKNLSLSAILNNELLTINGNIETFGYKVKPEINIQLDLDDFGYSEFGKTRIAFYDLSDDCIRIVNDIERDSGCNYLDKKNEIVLEISGDLEYPDLDWTEGKKVINSTKRMNANRDAVTAELMTFGIDIVQYHKKPARQGGGGNITTTAYTVVALGQALGWTVAEASAGETTTETCTYTLTTAPGVVTIVGVGTEKGNDGLTGVTATNTITLARKQPNSIVVSN